MAIEVLKAPQPLTGAMNRYRLFLGGSIEMGKAIDWQTDLTKKVSDFEGWTVLNPRRDDWDSSWVQDPTPGTKFHEQVTWELDAQDEADINVYYFADGTQSPITLLELGLYADSPVNFPIVYCTPKFWRYGNVKIVCDRYGVDVYDDYDKFVYAVRALMSEYENSYGE